MSPVRYMLSARDEESTASSAASTATASSSASPYPTESYGIPRVLPWVAVVLLVLAVAALLLFCRRRRTVVPQLTQIKEEEPRSSSETLLYPGWEKRSSIIATPPPAYTAAGDNVAPGQEDAVFRTSKNQRRALIRRRRSFDCIERSLGTKIMTNTKNPTRLEPDGPIEHGTATSVEPWAAVPTITIPDSELVKYTQQWRQERLYNTVAWIGFLWQNDSPSASENRKLANAKWFPGELVETHALIGLYLETAIVRLHQSADEIKMPSWDVGGCGKRIPLAVLAHFTQTAGSNALIWFASSSPSLSSSPNTDFRAVDSADRDGIPRSVEELVHVLDLLAYPELNPSDVPVLVLATKQDLPNAMTTHEIQNSFAPVVLGLRLFVVGTTLNQSLTEGALPGAFRWLLQSVQNAGAGRPPPPSPSDDPRSTIVLETKTKLDSWLERAEADSSAAEFLHQFQTVSLPAWDHYTHIRIIYSMLAAFGRHQGRDMILQGLEAYAALGDQACTRPLHITMSYFWIQDCDAESVSYLESMLDMDNFFDSESIISEPASDWTLLEDEKQGDGNASAGDNNEEPVGYRVTDAPSDAGFVRFLLLNPFVADEELWTECYSSEVMVSGKARARMVLPNKRHLPNLVGRDVIPSSLRSLIG
ncbi:hypothetical protein DFH07DRAFT_769114 [Mycena maculata]|uniref:Uncharacterized protein n=1 Tax=Mycena maculata TaxID=230809 RepID=A0AAD7JRK0_9AGAR|nr:hypothetical protein DFH07DRAFT_769114 [Mycena maculata]